MWLDPSSVLLYVMEWAFFFPAKSLSSPCGAWRSETNTFGSRCLGGDLAAHCAFNLWRIITRPRGRGGSHWGRGESQLGPVSACASGGNLGEARLLGGWGEVRKERLRGAWSGGRQGVSCLPLSRGRYQTGTRSTFSTAVSEISRPVPQPLTPLLPSWHLAACSIIKRNIHLHPVDTEKAIFFWNWFFSETLQKKTPTHFHETVFKNISLRKNVGNDWKRRQSWTSASRYFRTESSRRLTGSRVS